MSRIMLLGALLALAFTSTALAGRSGDKDKDGLPDRWERKYHVKSATADNDRDKLENETEYQIGSDPRERNSDHKGKADGAEDRDRDGLSNYFEQQTLNDPADKDTDDDGIRDGKENAGKIVSFDEGTGKLTINTGKKTVSGIVDDLGVACVDEEDLDLVDDEEEPEVGDAIRSVIRPSLPAADPVKLPSDDDDDEQLDCGTSDVDDADWVHEAEFDEDDRDLFAFVEVVK